MVDRKTMIAAAVLSLLLLVPLTAEGTLTMDMLLLESLQLDASDLSEFAFIPSGSAGLTYKSQGNRNVRSELSLDILLPDVSLGMLGTGESSIIPDTYSSLSLPLITLDRAYIKVRFPEFRITAGKTRLSWGDGFLFNSGDILSGSTDTTVDLTSSELRTQTYWMTSINRPLGPFSFLEAVILPDAGSSYQSVAAGGRFYTTIDTLKLEGGYIYAGDDDEHRIYSSLQGNLGFDWYLSSAAAVPSEWDNEEFEGSWSISAGAFYLYQVDSIHTLTLRLESITRPFGRWTEAEDSSENYGLYLYPECSYTLSDSSSLTLRSIISPVDLSAMISGAWSWNIYQDFSLIAYLTGLLGETGDTFPSEGMGSLTASLGMSFIY